MGMAVMSSTKPSPPAINWQDYNYPPCIRMWHYNPLELEPAPRFIVRVCHAAFVVPISLLVVNFFVSIILGCGGVTNAWCALPGSGWLPRQAVTEVWPRCGRPLRPRCASRDRLAVMYSFFNFVIGACLGLWVFMIGNRGVATGKRKKLRRYLICWGVLTLLQGLPALTSLSSFNGWIRLGALAALEDPSAQPMHGRVCPPLTAPRALRPDPLRTSAYLRDAPRLQPSRHPASGLHEPPCDRHITAM